jgi:hypothetical protein
MNDPRRLFTDGSNEFWMIMTQTRNANARHRIKITSAIRIPKPNTFTVCKGDG